MNDRLIREFKMNLAEDKKRLRVLLLRGVVLLAIAIVSALLSAIYGRRGDLVVCIFGGIPATATFTGALVIFSRWEELRYNTKRTERASTQEVVCQLPES